MIVSMLLTPSTIVTLIAIRAAVTSDTMTKNKNVDSPVENRNIIRFDYCIDIQKIASSQNTPTSMININSLFPQSRCLVQSQGEMA